MLAILILIYGYKRIDLRKNLNEKLADGISIPVFINEQKESLPDWSVDELVGKINQKRQELGLKVLSVNPSLNKAAKSRLSVIKDYEDILGEQTGITREQSLTAVKFEYGWVGDLLVADFFKTNDPIDYWMSIDNAKKTISEKNFTDIGVALTQNEERVTAYAILASKKKVATNTSNKVSWGGPDLWKEVNRRRVESGVNPLSQKDELCTIAAIRLNQLLDKNSLDNHEGFSPTLAREDLQWISQKYNISEFLVSGYKTAEESVKAWESTLGHKKLISGGEYVWGCVYAQNSFGVAIAAY